MKPSKSSRDWTFRIKDILQAIGDIQEYTKDITVSEFKKNKLVFAAVVRNLEIIGEASVHIPQALRDAHPDIPWKQMIAMRNTMIHEYFGVNMSIVWQAVQKDLPALKQQMLSIELGKKS